MEEAASPPHPAHQSNAMADVPAAAASSSSMRPADSSAAAATYSHDVRRSDAQLRKTATSEGEMKQQPQMEYQQPIEQSQSVPPPSPPIADPHPYRVYYPLHSVLFDAQGEQENIIDEAPASDFPSSVVDACNLDLSIPDAFQHDHLFEYATTNSLSRDSRWSDATFFVNYLISHQLLTLDMQLRLTYRLDATNGYAMRMHFQTPVGKQLFTTRWYAVTAARADPSTLVAASGA